MPVHAGMHGCFCLLYGSLALAWGNVLYACVSDMLHMSNNSWMPVAWRQVLCNESDQMQLIHW